MDEEHPEKSEQKVDSESTDKTQFTDVNTNSNVFDTDIRPEDFTQTFDPSLSKSKDEDQPSPESEEIHKEENVDELRPTIEGGNTVYDLEVVPEPPTPPPPPPPPPPNEQQKDLESELVPRATIIYKSGWGALPQKDPPAPPLPHPIDSVIFLHTGPGTEECHSFLECTQLLQDLQKKHMYEVGMPDIQYNFMVTSDNTIYEGRGWNLSATKTAMYKQYEGRSLDICFIGDFSRKDPLKEMTMTAISIISEGMLRNYFPDIIDFWPLRSRKPFKMDLKTYFQTRKILQP